MLLVTGTVLGVTEEMRGNPGSEWLQRTLHVLDGVNVHQMSLARDFRTGDVPEQGKPVSVEVATSAYAGKSGARVQLTALRLRDVTVAPAGKHLPKSA